jgi:hypothetical protein
MRLLGVLASVGLSTVLLTSAPPSLSREKSDAARLKIERISNEELQGGEAVVLTEDELNSFLRYDYAEVLPKGVRDLRVELGQDRGVTHALIDLAKLQAQSEEPPNTVWMALLGGERKLRAVCRYTSADGQAVAEIESAELDGTSLPLPLLKWLVETTIGGEMEDFELGKPYPLPANLRQIRLEPAQAVITAK